VLRGRVEALESNPEGFESGLAISLAAEETSERRDDAGDLPKRRDAFGDVLRPLSEGNHRLPFVLLQERRAGLIGIMATRHRQEPDAPRNHEVDG
jgi:hypothetical protein